MNPQFISPTKDKLFLALKEEVYHYFEENGTSRKASRAMWLKAFLMIFGMFFFYFLLLFGGLSEWQMLICASILGIFVAGVGCNVSHDALHNSFSHKGWVNKMLGYSMDFIGSNSYLWKSNHNIHHYYTNVSGMDGDIRENVAIRFSPHVSYRKSYRVQLFTLFFVYASFFLLIVYSFNINNFIKQERLGKKISHPTHEVVKLILWKLWYVFFWLVIPYYVMQVSLGEFLLGYLVMNISAGYLFAFNFMAPHNFEEALYTEFNESKPVSWAEHQLKTTCNFKTKNIFLSYFIGGLNYQIEHHLFPEISSIHYPKVSVVIKKVTDDFGLHYHEKASFLKMVFSHFILLRYHSFPD